MYLEICLIISGIAIFLLLVIFCIPILTAIWRTTKDVAVTLETLNSEFARDFEKSGRNNDEYKQFDNCR